MGNNFSRAGIRNMLIYLGIPEMAVRNCMYVCMSCFKMDIMLQDSIEIADS
jgi:hypothetical protein